MTPERSTDSFVEYKEQTAPNISIIEPEFDFISIFDPNYILDNMKDLPPVIPQGISKGVVRTGSNDNTKKSKKPSRIEENIRTDEFDDGFATSDNVEYIEYTIPIRQLIDHIKDRTHNFFNGKRKNLLVYSHKNSLANDGLGRIGNSIFINNTDIIDDKVEQILEGKKGFEPCVTITDKRLNGSVYAIQNNKNYNFFKEEINDEGIFTWNSKLDNPNSAPGQIVEATSEEYRNIKLSNLPAPNKQSLNLKVMDPWVPTPSTAGFNLTGNTDLAFVEKANIAEINAQFLGIASTVGDAKAELSKKFQNSHVNFESIISTAEKQSSYLDYKVSDLDIQYQTPDKIVGKGQFNSIPQSATLRYSPQITNNKKKIGLTRQRRTKVQPRMFGILLAAMNVVLESTYGNKFDEILIRSGGDIPLYAVNSRNLSKTIRHDSGYAADIEIRRKGKAIGLTADAKPNTVEFIDNNLIWFYLKTCKELGATGIGADYDYDKGKAFHIDIAKDNPDFKTDKYKRSFKINLKGEATTITQAQVNRSMNSITSVRYWGKHDKSGSFKKEAAPTTLKNIFK